MPKTDNQLKSIDGIFRTPHNYKERGNAALKVATWIFSLSALAVANFFVAQHIVNNRADTLESRQSTQQPQLSESLQQLARQNALSVDSSGQLVLNGQLRLNNAAVLDPSDTPDNPVAGQLYMNKLDNQLYYYDGTKFVALATGAAASAAAATSTTTATTQVVSNPGVLSLQGKAGALTLTAGSGVAINGLTVSNTGVRSLSVGPGLAVSGMTGDVSISLAQDISTAATPQFAGLTLVAPLGVGSGGTGSGTAVGARSNLGAAASGANSDITSITGLTTALSVGQGGTGLSGIAAAGLLVGSTSGQFTVVAPTATGQCLLANTSTTLAFAACPGGGSGGITAGASHTSGRLTKWSDNTGGVVTDALLGDDGTTVYGYGDLILTRPSGESTTAFKIQNGAEIALLTADTSNMVVTVTNLAVTGHLVSSGAAISVTSVVHSASGDTCTVHGNDTAGKITYTTGSSPVAGTECTLTFTAAYAQAPNVVISGNNAASSGTQPFAVSSAGTTLDFGVNAGSLPPSTTYMYDYVVIGNTTP